MPSTRRSLAGDHRQPVHRPARCRSRPTTPDGIALSVGVWRWPFDPVCPGLPHAVTPSSCAAFLAGLVAGPVRLEVVAYRPDPAGRGPCRRRRRAGRLPQGPAPRARSTPSSSATTVPGRRCARARRARQSTPTGACRDGELPGATVRERLRTGARHRSPDAAEYEAIFAALAAPSSPPPTPSPAGSRPALRHAAMLATVLLARNDGDSMSSPHGPRAGRRTAGRRSGRPIHGDLYEAQLVTGRGRHHADDHRRPRPRRRRARRPARRPGDVIAHLLERALDDRGDRPAVAGYARRPARGRSPPPR